MLSSIITPLEPFIFVIFGGTGDLAQNKLVPALFSLYQRKQISKNFYIIGFSRRDLGDNEYCDFLTDALNKRGKIKDTNLWQEFVKHLHYQMGNFAEMQGYDQLALKLNDYERKLGQQASCILYLATPPDNYLPILTHLQEAKLTKIKQAGRTEKIKVAIEKPFGKDIDTARMLDEKLAEVFEEEQIFRVDHYLGKETVQNLLAFRFANGMFEPIWKSEYVDHVQITWMEGDGVGKRGKFFDGVGILRDVAQNHLMQLLSAVAMEQPKSFEKESIRDVRAAAIGAIECIEPSDVSGNVIRGQYKSYLSEKDVMSGSKTETYVAMKLYLNTPRFKHIPFYLRAGKKMPNEVMEISIVFKQMCHILFKEYGCPEIGNVITFRIQPDEGIRIRVNAKTPGTKLSLETIDMKYNYKEHTEHRISDAYEKVLLDIFSGDQMLFNRSDELVSSWTFISKILEGWRDAKVPLYIYEDNSSGPEEANKLIEKDGRKWL